MSYFGKIAGTGSYLPSQILTNFDLEKRVETSHEWIVDRTGIEERRIAGPTENVHTMGSEAARLALKAAGLSPSDVGMVIVATCSADKIFPATACLIQQSLGIPAGPAFDIQAACSGFIYALSVADQFIRTGMVKSALVIGSEVMSRVVDWTDRKTCVLFADGAGAVVLTASKEAGILSTHIAADGQHKDILYLNNPRMNAAETLNPDPNPDIYLQMQGNAVFRLAVNMLDQVAVRTIQENQLECSDIDWLIPHQANIRIIQAMAEKLGIPMERVAMTLKHHGNTSAASIPITLDTYIRQGLIQRDQMLLLEAIGGGLTWGTALVRY